MHFSDLYNPPEIAPSRGEVLDPHVTRGSFGLCKSLIQIASQSVQPFLHGTPCDQHTDRQTTLRATSVAMGHINAVRAMRPNKLCHLFSEMLFPDRWRGIG